MSKHDSHRDNNDPAAGQAASQEGGWEACEAGTLVQLGDRLRGESRRRRQLQLVGSAGAAAILLILASFLMPAGSDAPDALACDEVQVHLAAYDQQTLDDESLRERIAAHLEHCPFCQRKLRELRQSSGRQESSAAGLPAPVAAILPAIQPAF